LKGHEISGGVFILGTHIKEILRKSFEYEEAAAAVALFAEWVDIGKLRKSVKHRSNLPYVYYPAAFYLKSSLTRLYNEAIDEIIVWYEATVTYPHAENSH
jgi:hypothetical protein